MTDANNQSQRIPGPSPELVAELRSVVDSKEIEAKYPTRHASARQALETALAAPGYQPPPTDPRTAMQRQYDQMHGVEPHSPGDFRPDPWSVSVADGVNKSEFIAGACQWAAELGVQPDLGRALIRELAAAKDAPDRAVVAAALSNVGVDYTTAIRDAEDVLQTARTAFPGRPSLRATDFSAAALRQLSIWASHARRHAAGRPK